MNNNVSFSTHQRIRKALADKKVKESEEALAKQGDQNTDKNCAESATDISKMSLNELRKFAADNNIDITGLNRKEAIRNYIMDTCKSPEDEDSGNADSDTSDGESDAGDA